MVVLNQEFLERTLGLQNVTSSGGNWMCSCPFAVTSPEHGNNIDLHPSFGISKKDGVWNCFTCGCRGNLIGLVEKLLGYTFQQARSFVQGEATTEFNLSQVKDRVKNLFIRQETVKVFDGSLPTDCLFTLPDAAYIFLYERRHIFDSVIRHFRLGYCTSGFYQNRIIIPVSQGGQACGFIARSVSDSVRPKYLYPAAFPKKALLFNLDNVSGDTIFLVEGAFDVMQLWQGGILNSAAILCSDLSQEQVGLLLQKNFKRVILLFDSDLAGHKAQKNALKKLIPYFEVSEARLPFGKKDPGELFEPEDFNFVLTSVHLLSPDYKARDIVVWESLKNRLKAL